ncbi:MAG: lysylphosphatidylglycerol synthase transmembrane domain-containing protein [Bacteroidota bacterium]
MWRFPLPLGRMKSFAIRLYQSLRADTSPLWLRVAQFLITVCVLGFVYHRLSQEDWQDWSSRMPNALWQQGFLLLTVMLIPLNLGLETRKWQVLVRSYYPQITFLQLFKAVLAGMATGIFTPNRIGEYAGRVMSLPQGFRLEAGTHTLVNRLLQMMATLLVGTLSWFGLWYFGQPQFRDLIGIDTPLALGIGGILVLSVLIFLWILLRPQWLLMAFRIHRWDLPFVQRIYTALLGLGTPQILSALGLALLRYAVFTTQYVLLLYAFGYEGILMLALGLIGLCFLIKSLLPSIALTELGVRESVALWLMGAFSIAAFTVVGSTFILYICNLILPSILGLYFVYRIRA